jgi:hypothetical protein
MLIGDIRASIRSSSPLCARFVNAFTTPAKSRRTTRWNRRHILIVDHPIAVHIRTGNRPRSTDDLLRYSHIRLVITPFRRRLHCRNNPWLKRLMKWIVAVPPAFALGGVLAHPTAKNPSPGLPPAHTAIHNKR